MTKEEFAWSIRDNRKQATLDKRRAERKAVADKKLAENAVWETDMLSVELGELDTDGFDLSLIGFDEDALAGLLVDKTEGLTDPDEVPEAPE